VRVKQFIGSEYVTHIEQIHPPQPVESPDDWVTQDLVPSRRGIDELNWIFSGERHGSWVPFRNGPPITHGVTDKCGDIGQVRCRRRDYPQKPAEVHSGGPYVARSEYERVCLERDALLEDVNELHREGAVAAAENRAKKISEELANVRRELANEKASSGQVIAELRHRIEAVSTESLTSDASWQEAYRLLSDECQYVKDERARLIQQVNSQIDQIADLIDRQSEANHINPNGWPLVPVDPSCIPDGHRAVEVTGETKDKLVAVGNRAVRFPTNADHSNLVVEPIPTPPTPDALPRPEFPKWIRAGWWVAMDPDLLFWGFENEPIVDEQCGEHTSIGKSVLLYGAQITPSMRAVPCDRWREAKWQIE